MQSKWVDKYLEELDNFKENYDKLVDYCSFSKAFLKFSNIDFPANIDLEGNHHEIIINKNLKQTLLIIVFYILTK